MNFDGYLSDDPPYPSYLLGMITNVNATKHTVDIQPYRLIEPFTNVPLIRTSGNITLPSVGAIAIVIFDDRITPVVIGFAYPFTEDAQKNKEIRKIKEGDVVLIQPEMNCGLTLTKKGFFSSMLLKNRSDHGFEVDEETGLIVASGHSSKFKFGGVVERSGLVRRPRVISNSPFSSDTQEDIVKKLITMPLSVPGNVYSGVEAYPYEKAGLLKDLIEKQTEIKVPGSQTLLLPEGINIYKETLGHVIKDTPNITGSYDEELNQTTGFPLRKKTVFYDETGLIELVKEEIDAFGNINLFINAMAAQGLKITSLAPLLASFLTIAVSSLGPVAITAATSVSTTAGGASTMTAGANATVSAGVDATLSAGVNVNMAGSVSANIIAPLINLTGNVGINGGTDPVVLAIELCAAFNSHTHTTGSLGSPTSVPIVPLTSVMVGATALKST